MGHGAATSKAAGAGLISEGVFHSFQTAGISHPAPYLDDVLRALGLVYQKCEAAQKPRSGLGAHLVLLWEWGRIQRMCLCVGNRSRYERDESGKALQRGAGIGRLCRLGCRKESRSAFRGSRQALLSHRLVPPEESSKVVAYRRKRFAHAAPAQRSPL